jgi:hypothetical protein
MRVRRVCIVCCEKRLNSWNQAALLKRRAMPFSSGTRLGPYEIPRQQYAVIAKGDRFLVNTVIEPSLPAPVTIVLNWTAALKKGDDMRP